MEDYIFTENEDKTKSTEKQHIIWDGLIGVQAF